MDKSKIKKNKTPVLLGVIPARSGSKGIKNKNLRRVSNRPLIYYTIKDALTYKQLYETIVTTDSMEIARVAKKYKAKVPFIRPKKLSTDNTSMLEVLDHALIKCEKIYSLKIDGIVLLDPTSPIRNKDDIRKMINTFLEKNADLVVAVAKSRRNPYFNMVKINEDGYAKIVLKGDFIRRQDASSVFDITNNCWIYSRRAIKEGWRIPRKTIAYESKNFWIDIDREEELKFLEWYLKVKKGA